LNLRKKTGLFALSCSPAEHSEQMTDALYLSHVTDHAPQQQPLIVLRLSTCRRVDCGQPVRRL